MPRLKAWVKKHLQSKTTIQKHPKDQLPFLSTSRRSVTPTVFDAPTSPFFQLPYDIRSLIVLMALGNRASIWTLSYKNVAGIGVAPSARVGVAIRPRVLSRGTPMVIYEEISA